MVVYRIVHIYQTADNTQSHQYKDVVTCTLIISSDCVYALIDPGSTMPYLAPFIAEKLCIIEE